MVCPNCQSKQLVTVDGKRLCGDCGQLIPIKSTKTAKKRPVGRPRRPRLDIAQSRPVANQVATHRSQSRRTVAPPTPPARRLNDLQPAATTPSPPRTPHAVPNLFAEAWQASIRPRLLVQALPLAFASLLPVAVTYLQWTRLATAWSRPTYNSAVGELAWSLGFSLLFALITTGAVAHAGARLADRRDETGRYSLRRGLSSVWPAPAIALLNLIIIAATVAVVWAIALSCTVSHRLSSLAAQIIIGAASIGGAYLICGALIAGGLALAAVALSDLSALAAWRLGWRSYMRHFELVAAWLTVVLGWAAIIAATIGAGRWIGQSYSLPLWFGWSLIGVAVAVITLLIGLQSGAAVSLAYRHVVTRDRLADSSRLLLGDRRRGPWSLIFPLLLAIGLLAATITWQIGGIH